MNIYLYPTLGRTNLVYFKLKNSLYLQIQYDIIEKTIGLLEQEKIKVFLFLTIYELHFFFNF